MMLRAVLLVFGVLLAGVAQAGQCPAIPPKPTTIHVELYADQPRVDHLHARHELRSFDISTVSPYGNSQRVHINGLMRGAIALETQSAVAWQHSRATDENCYWFDNITLLLKLNPTIYIAREIPATTCLYREVLAHEHKHYNTDLRVAQDYQNLFRVELQKFVSQMGVIGPFVSSTVPNPKDQMMQRLEQMVSALNDKMKFDRISRQALIDTREEYERVASTCPTERHLM